MTKRGLEEGERCNRPMNDAGDLCDGTLEYPPVVGCYCHINPPCGACLDRVLECTACFWQKGDPEPGPMIYEYGGTRFWVEPAAGPPFVEVPSFAIGGFVSAPTRPAIIGEHVGRCLLGRHDFARGFDLALGESVSVTVVVERQADGSFTYRTIGAPPSYPPEAWVETPRQIERRA